ncbi:MAG: CocE/NonD family hydrolase [Thermoplasmatales archaeon]|jgi:putative CocE/NonD family hydrolase|nr:CocE/NonD family hydrolase [Candidatus Thermoplasmatota archaeon]MDA8054478.1 CocE/NonD family hydrolase [Thermoplasmatales archaeon]
MTSVGSELIHEFGVKQKMSDGVYLSSDIFRPKEDRKFPVILTRSPYLTMNGYFERLVDDARFFARNGYVFIIQDCRGKNDSEGKYNPFHDDGKDGFDTIEWISEQPWSNGKVGMVGNSYAAWNQWATAVLNPPNLKTIISVVALPDPVINVPYQGGELVLTMAEWVALIEGRRNTPTAIYDTESILSHLPVREIDKMFGRNSRIWQDWLDHPSLDEYWKETLYENKLDRVKIPAMHISGWYDDDLIGTHTNYTGIANSPSYDPKGYFQKLVIGPWPHHLNTTTNLGGIEFGPQALIDLRGLKLRWFNRFLKGENNGIDKESPVDIFLMGINEWSKETSWPPKNMAHKNLYLSSYFGANSLFGDGRLSENCSDKGKQYDEYIYDPSNPTPHISEGQDLSAEGPFDQRSIERRDDVLVFQSEVLKKRMEVIGSVRLYFWASTSSVDTDYWGQVTDVYPNGYSLHLTENIIRAKYREGLDNPKEMIPGEATPMEIDLWIVGNVFLEGHRIRLDLSSSSFPKYARNLNNGKSNLDSSDFQVATQRIYHGSDYMSYLQIPVRKNKK